MASNDVPPTINDTWQGDLGPGGDNLFPPDVKKAKRGLEHDGLVIYMANQYFPLCDAATDFDDLVQAGRIGVMRAMATYEPGKGAFSTWAVFHIRNEFRQILPRMRPVSLDVEVGEDGVPLVDLLPAKGEGPDKRMERQAVRETVRERVALLPEEQRKAVTLHDLEGRSMEETAEACGKPRSLVVSLRLSAFSTLRRDRVMKELAGLDRRTNWHMHKGLKAWQSDWTSSTVALAFWRMGAS